MERTPVSQNHRNRLVWDQALAMGWVAAADLERLCGGLAPEHLREDLAELLVQDGLIGDEQKEELAQGWAVPLDHTIPVDQEQTIYPIDQEQTLLLSPEAAERQANTAKAFDQEETVLESAPDGHSRDATVVGFSAETQPEPSAATAPSLAEKEPRDATQKSNSATAAEVRRSRTMTGDDLDRIRRYRDGAPDIPQGVNLGGYRIEGKLGAGGMGDVYEAVQISLNRPVALKVLPTSLASKSEFIDRFYREARTLASFAHANIVQVYDVGEVEGLHFFTMEEVRGKTFKDLLNEEGIPVPILTNLLKQSLRGLARAQQAGVIHRDIKPGNLLISDAGDVKIVDFGLAENVEESGEFHSESVVGTPLYLAPEQVTNEPLTFKTDMYALGAAFFHLCVGEPPYKGRTAMETSRMHVEQPVPNASDANSSVPKGFAAILAEMMAKHPADRYASYKELFDSVEAFELQNRIITSRSEFLSESLMAIGEYGVRGIVNKIAFMAFLGVAMAMLAIGIHNILATKDMYNWIATSGDAGTLLFVLAILFITYVAMARKKVVPVIGRIQTWMYAHIVCAIISFFLVTIHSGNFFTFFIKKGVEVRQYPDRIIYDFVPIIPFLNSMIFLIVIISGLVGATIWRDVLKQVTLEQIQHGQQKASGDSKITMAIFSQRVFKYWRIIHYPLAVALALLTILHVVSIWYYRGF